MKRTTLLLAFAIGVSTLSALGQSQGDQASQLKSPPTHKDGDEARKLDKRAEKKEMKRADKDRKQGGDQFARPQMRRQGPAFDGPQRRFAPGQGFGAQRGQAWNGPQAGPRQLGTHPEVCPHCNRPFDLGAARGPQFRNRQGLGPRAGVGPMQRKLGPQARGPAFGPPPWAGRGELDRGAQPGFRGPRQEGPAMNNRGNGPMRRGPAVADRDEQRREDRDQAGPRDERAPRDQDRRPVEQDDR